jgi:hypothetical protein
MKVLVVSPFAIMNATFETDLEIVQSHVDSGDDVVLLGCRGDLAACDPNPNHDLSLCVRCVSRGGSGLKLLTGPVDVRRLVQPSASDREEIARLPRSFVDLEALRALRIEDFDLGWGVLSSLVSATREAKPDPARYADLIHRMLVSAATVYRSVQRHIDEVTPDRVYIFNGRFAVTRAVLRAAHSRGVDCYMQDRGSSFRHYALFKNRLAHDPAYFQELIRELWEGADPREREIMGASFFIESAQGVSHFWHSYVSAQKADELPPGWDEAKNNVVVYTSSDDEFAAIGDVMTNPVYRDQYDGLVRIAKAVQSTPSTHVYVRVHPNAHTMRDSFVAEVKALHSQNVTVIEPTSPVSTYALMRRATRVLTFGSTTGIEAVYWGKPSILAGVSYYDGLGGTYNAKSHDDVMALLTQPNLAPKDQQAALMFGYFTRAYGIRFRYFQPNGLPGGPFRGVALRPTPVARVAARALETPLLKPLGKVHLRMMDRKLSV